MLSRDVRFSCLLLRIRLLIDFRLDETGEISNRGMPSEIACFHRNGVRAFLHEVDLGTDRNSLERHRHLHFTEQIGVIEFICVAQVLPSTSSSYFPPNEWLMPVVKLRSDILKVPPTLASN